MIKETDTNCDVRFFGGKYERSILPKNLVKPIDISMQTLNVSKYIWYLFRFSFLLLYYSQIKKSAAFNKAYQELLLHQKLLADPGELTKLLVKSKKKVEKPTSHSLELPSKPVNKSTKRKHNSLDLNKDVYDFDESSVPTLSYTPKSLARKPSPSMYKVSHTIILFIM